MISNTHLTLLRWVPIWLNKFANGTYQVDQKLWWIGNMIMSTRGEYFTHETIPLPLNHGPPRVLDINTLPFHKERIKL